MYIRWRKLSIIFDHGLMGWYDGDEPGLEACAEPKVDDCCLLGAALEKDGCGVRYSSSSACLPPHNLWVAKKNDAKRIGGVA